MASTFFTKRAVAARESLDNNTGRWVRAGGALGRCPGRWVALGGGLGRCRRCPVPSVSGVTPRWPVSGTAGEHISKSPWCVDVFKIKFRCNRTTNGRGSPYYRDPGGTPLGARCVGGGRGRCPGRWVAVGGEPGRCLSRWVAVGGEPGRWPPR